MQINDVLRFLETSQNEVEIVPETTIAQMKNFALEFLRRLDSNEYEYRWRILMALYLAEMHCPAIHETYLVNELESIKKSFSALEESIMIGMKKTTAENKNIQELQLTYLYRMFNYYVSRAKKLAKLHQHSVLEDKLEKELHSIHEKSLMRSRNITKTISLYQLRIKRKFKKHYYIYGLISALGIISFWHGLWGIFDLLHIHPLITTGVGLIILVLTGIFMHEFLGVKSQKEETQK